MSKNMKREDQIKFKELINRKQRWIKKVFDEININSTNESYKQAISFINFDTGTNIEIEKLLLKYYIEEKFDEVYEVDEVKEVDESTYEDVKVEDEQDNI